MWFARTLFGEFAGILAALLLLSEPNIIGNATLVQDDLAAALMLLVFVIALRHYFKQPSVIRAALLGVVLGLALLSYPNCLTHFNALAGGTTGGWRRLSDSNVETGQEVKALADYLKRHDSDTVAALCIGVDFLRYYGIKYCYLPCDAAGAGLREPPQYVAIGPWYLEEVDVTPEQKAAIEPFRNRQPEAMIGDSIFVFRVP